MHTRTPAGTRHPSGPRHGIWPRQNLSRTGGPGAPPSTGDAGRGEGSERVMPLLSHLPPRHLFPPGPGTEGHLGSEVNDWPWVQGLW